MATKSFLRNACITDSKSAEIFVNTLLMFVEKATNGIYEEKIDELSRPNIELKGNEIKKFFGHSDC